MLCKSIDWFLYDNSLRHERANQSFPKSIISNTWADNVSEGQGQIWWRLFYVNENIPFKVLHLNNSPYDNLLLLCY